MNIQTLIKFDVILTIVLFVVCCFLPFGFFWNGVAFVVIDFLVALVLLRSFKKRFQ